MIAVILPIYNQEKYLARALDSLAAQTCRDFVAICVNDGSTDRTAEILEEYKRRTLFPMRVITKLNGGVSSARNAGLDVVSRLSDVTHVSFLDPDDFVHPQCYEIVTHFAAERPLEAFSWGWLDAGDEPIDAFLARRYETLAITPGSFAKGEMVWNKAFPVAAIRDVRFNEQISFCEDTAYVYEACHCGRFKGHSLPVNLYYYDSVPSSAMNRLPDAHMFAERRAAVNYMVSIFADDPIAREDFCRHEVAGMLKRFYRGLRRTLPAETKRARCEFVGLLLDLWRKNALWPHQGRFKDFKYYVIFRWMIWRESEV